MRTPVWEVWYDKRSGKAWIYRIWKYGTGYRGWVFVHPHTGAVQDVRLRSEPGKAEKEHGGEGNESLPGQQRGGGAVGSCSAGGEALDGRGGAGAPEGPFFGKSPLVTVERCVGIHHITAIPSTPAAVGEGIYTCEKRHSLTEEGARIFHSPCCLTSAWRWRWRQGKSTSANTISGCGPAFASMFIEALGDAGVMYGLTRPQAYELAAGMMAGTGKLMLHQGKHPGQMKDDVCSPGGTTIRGVAALERAGPSHSRHPGGGGRHEDL